MKLRGKPNETPKNTILLAKTITSALIQNPGQNQQQPPEKPPFKTLNT
jgi:hypothetical protein